MSDATHGIMTITDASSSPTRVRDYIDLLKPRVMSLVVFTGLVGLLIAPGHIHPFTAALAVLAIALGSGAAGAINMWYERDIDALMARTANRPLPARSEEHTSELQSRENLVCRLLLEKKK